MKIEIPEYEYELKNLEEVLETIGDKIKIKVKNNIEKGQNFDGSPMYRPKDGGKPMDRTGKLKSSIRIKSNKKKTSLKVEPFGSRGRGRVNNAGLATILSQEVNGRPAMKPFGITKDDADRYSKLAEKLLKVELKTVRTKTI